MLAFVVAAALVAVVSQPAPPTQQQQQIERVRAHLLRAAAVVRQKPGSAARDALLDALVAYAERGVFPHNHDHAGRVPVFIDDHDTFCAVGHLLRVSGHEDVARDVAAADVNVRAGDIVDARVLRWADDVGFSLDDLALIQPGYETFETTWDRDGWASLGRRCASFPSAEIVADAHTLHERWRARASPPTSRFGGGIVGLEPGWEQDNLHEALRAFAAIAVRNGCVDDLEAVAAAFPGAHLGRSALRVAACDGRGPGSTAAGPLWPTARLLVAAPWVEVVQQQVDADEAFRCVEGGEQLPDGKELIAAFVARGFDPVLQLLPLLNDDVALARALELRGKGSKSLEAAVFPCPPDELLEQHLEEDGRFGWGRYIRSYVPAPGCRHGRGGPQFVGTLLAHAVLAGRPTTVRLLLDRGARPNTPTPLGTAAHIAARNREFAILALLAERGAHLGACDDDGVSVGAAALQALYAELDARPLAPLMKRFRADQRCKVRTATALQQLTPQQQEQLK